MTLTLLGIIGLILLGMFLLLIELVVLPGLVTGIAGFALITGGIWGGYSWFGPTTGTIILISTILANFLMVTWALRSKSWKRMLLSDAIDTKVNMLETLGIVVGDKGKTVSRLAPAGKANINDHLIEVHSDEGFIDPEIPITVHRVLQGKIIVRKS